MHKVLGLLACSLLSLVSAPQAGAEALIAKLPYGAILPQPLAGALHAWATQTGWQVLYDSALTANRRSNGSSGAASPVDGLARILEGSGLTFQFVNERTVAILPTVSAGYWPGASRLRLGAGSVLSRELMRTVSTEAGQAAGSQNGPIAEDHADISHNPTSMSQVTEVLVTAQKREENLQNVPISISVLSGDDLDSSRFQGVSEAMNAVPGVATSTAYLGGGSLVVIRGVGASFPQTAGSSPVAYYLDSAPFGLVRSAVGPDPSAYDLERVEVLRGPQGTLYGAGGMGGVVRILTQDAELSGFDFKARASGSGTERGGDNYRGDAAVNVPIVPDKLAARAVVGYVNSSGWIDQPNTKDANDSQQRTYRLKVNAKPTPEFSIGLSAWMSKDDADAPPVGYSFDKSATEFDQPTSTDYNVYGAKLGYDFPSFSISSMSTYLDYTNRGTVGLDVVPFNGEGIFYSKMWSNVFSQELNLSSLHEGPWRWSAGTIYRRGTENAYQIFTVFDVPPYSSFNTSKSYAVYGEVTRLLLDSRLELTVGTRHFHDDESQSIQTSPDTLAVNGEESFKANTPRGVLTWHAGNELMFYGSYSQGFRSGFPQDPVVAGLGFAPVSPDRLRNYEVGSKGSLWDGRISYDAAAYYMDWESIQQQLTVLPPVNYIAVVNGEGASGIGADLALSIEPTKNLVLRAGLSWNSLKLDTDVISGGEVLFRKGDRLAASPEMNAGTSAEYVFPLGAEGYRGKLTGSVNYTSSQAYRNLIDDNVVIQNGDPITIARASLSVDSPTNWTASLFVDNLNNEKGSPVEAFVGTENWNSRVRPRTIGLQLEYRFR